MSGVLLGTLAASLLGNTLAGKGILQASDGVVRTVHGGKIFNSASSFD